MRGQNLVIKPWTLGDKELLIDVKACAASVTYRNMDDNGVAEMISSHETEATARHADLSAQLKAIEDKLRAIEECLMVPGTN